MAKTNLDNLQNKLEPEFTYEDLLKTINFNINSNIEKIESYGYNFTFELEGKLNKDKPENIQEIELDLIEVDDNKKLLQSRPK